jgi:hypothetical protein
MTDLDIFVTLSCNLNPTTIPYIDGIINAPKSDKEEVNSIVKSKKDNTLAIDPPIPKTQNTIIDLLKLKTSSPKCILKIEYI